jgi:hypothetical protein
LGTGALRSSFWIGVWFEEVLAVRIERRRVTPKKMIAIHVVKRERTAVVCDPKTLSVRPPPKADPRPSLRGRCIRTTTIMRRHTRRCTAIKIGMRILIEGRASYCGGSGCKGAN